jgi:hypothetical protein
MSSAWAQNQLPSIDQGVKTTQDVSQWPSTGPDTTLLVFVKKLEMLIVGSSHDDTHCDYLFNSMQSASATRSTSMPVVSFMHLMKQMWSPGVRYTLVLNCHFR